MYYYWLGVIATKFVMYIKHDYRKRGIADVLVSPITSFSTKQKQLVIITGASSGIGVGQDYVQIKINA